MGGASIDTLLEQAISALNRGDVDAARALADEVLSADAGNADAAQLRSAAVPPTAEIRRLTVLFCDIAGSTELSARLEPEAYHSVLVRYQDRCRSILEERFGGSIISFRGDGVLAAFGYPEAHEDDVDRAVAGSLALLEELERLSDQLVASIGEPLRVRMAAHKGVVLLDRAQGDLYGFAVNVAARLEQLAEPGTVVVSDQVAALVGDRFDLEAHPPREVKGVAEPMASHTVRGRRARRGADAGRPLVGRDAELAVLREAWRAARSGTRPKGACVAIVGEAGIGKSRLAAELALEIAVDGGSVVELGGAALQSGAGLWPIRRLLEDQAALAGVAEPRQRLDRLRNVAGAAGLDETGVALLATLLGIEPEAGYSPVESDDRRLREQIEEAVLALLRSIVGGTGTLLLAEDLHWFDPATRDLLARLVRDDQPHLLVVLTSRDPSAVPRGDLTTVVELEPLDEPARLELVRALAGDELPLRAVEQVAARSDGIPLFASELVQAARLPATAASGADLVLAAAALEEPDRTIPEVLYEPLAARLNVSPAAMEVAAVAALVGREVDRALLLRACSLPTAELHAGIEALLTAGVLEPHATRPDHLRFHHELVRAVVEDLQTPLRRRQLHRQVADALLAGDADGQAVDWFVIGSHLEGAGDPGRAADAFARAAAAARRRGDLLEARSILSRGIDLVSAPGVDLPRQEVDLRLRRGYLSVSLEGNTSATALADYDRCLELVAGGDDRDGLVTTLACIGAYWMAKGDLDRCDALYVPLSELTGPREAVARFLAATGMAIATFYRGDLRRAVELAEAALDLMGSLGGEDDLDAWSFVPLDPRATSHATAAMARFLMGDVEAWQEQIRASRAAANALPFPSGAFTLAGFLTFEVWMHIELGFTDAVPALLDELDEISARHGFDQWSIVSATQREVFDGLQAAERGADPADLVRRANLLGGYLAMWKTMDTWVFLTYYTSCQGRLYAAAGERELARATYEESLAIGRQTQMRFYDAETLRHLAAVQDEPAEGVRLLHEAIALAQEQGGLLNELRSTMDLYRATGDAAPLRSTVERFTATSSYPTLDAARALLGGAARPPR
jgi:class 3 adenylate cyclase/tetratricopeptide (TPR) repeat protein